MEYCAIAINLNEILVYICSVDKKTVTIGKTENLQVTIELSNDDEVSYNPEIVVTHDDTLEFVSVEARNVSVLIFSF